MPKIQREILKDLIRDRFVPNLVKEEDRIYGIEIGTLQGETLNFILEHTLKLCMIAIDCAPEWGSLGGILYKYGDRTQVLHMKSDEAIVLLKGKEFDFIWIDGDHEYEQVKRDIIHYQPLIKSGGILGGHDYGMHATLGVTIAVDELLKNKGYELHLDDDGVWWVNV